MDRLRVPLAFFASFGELFAIFDHRQPEEPVAFYFDGYGSSPGMIFAQAFVNFFHDFASRYFFHASH